MSEESLSPEWGEGPWPGVHPTSTEDTQFQRPEWLSSIPNFVQWLIEHILRAIVLAILGIFINGPLGTAFPHLQQWAIKLETRFGTLHDRLGTLFGGLDFVDGTVGDGFNLGQAIHNLIDNLLPAGRLAELFGGRLKAGQEPQTLLDTWQAITGLFDGDPGHVQIFFTNLRNSIIHGIDGLDGQLDGVFDPVQAIHNLIDNLLPAGRLAELFGGRLKAGQEPQTLLDMLTNLRDAFGGHDFGDPGFNLHDAISGLIDVLLPQGRLAELFSGRLKAGQEPQTLLDTWKHLRDAVLGDDPSDGDEPGFHLAAQILQRLAVNADDAAQTGLHLFNFPLSQPLFGHTNPTMHAPIGFLHLRKFTASGSTVTTHTDPESIAVTQTVSVGGFNRFDRSLDVDLVSFRAKASGTLTAVTVHLWRMDTTTGDMTFIQSETIVPASLPTSAFDMVYVPLTVPVHVDAGTVIGTEITVTGSGTLAIAGTTVPWLTDDLSARPKRVGFSRAVNAGATPPSTIADASVSYNTTVPAVALGQSISALPIPKYTYSESFNGSTAAWRALAGGLLFTGGTFRTATTGANFALFNYATNGDSVRAEFSLRAVWNILNPSFNQGDKIRLAICCSSSASQYAALEIESNRTILSTGADHSLRIVTGTSPTVTTTRTTTVSLDGTYAGLIAIEYDLPSNIFSVFLGGSDTALFGWTDGGNVIQHGPSFRQAAIFANFGNNDQIVCDNFSFRDI